MLGTTENVTGMSKSSVSSPKLQSLPSCVKIEPCTEQYVNSFRRLNALLLPIPYRDDFYKEIVNDDVIASITRIALWHDTPSSIKSTSLSANSQSNPPRLVSAIRCRLLASPPNDPMEKTPVLYISTITTLAPFRRHALANHLLATVANTAVDCYGVTAIMAHVWEANEEGLEWYKKRGFEVVAKEENYYRRLAPKTMAFLMRKNIGPGDVLAWKDLP